MVMNKFEVSEKMDHHEGTVFELEVIESGAAFLGKMTASGETFHVSINQARTLEEVEENFELFKRGFIKLQKLIEEGPITGFVPIEKRITFKQARILSGKHPAVLAERMGISIKQLSRLENGELKKGIPWDAAVTHYKNTRISGMLLDHIDWSLGQQKNHHSAK